jgi:hypothetical protein
MMASSDAQPPRCALISRISAHSPKLMERDANTIGDHMVNDTCVGVRLCLPLPSTRAKVAHVRKIRVAQRGARCLLRLQGWSGGRTPVVVISTLASVGRELRGFDPQIGTHEAATNGIQSIVTNADIRKNHHLREAKIAQRRLEWLS